jgi:Ca-activated chloride channel family protein
MNDELDQFMQALRQTPDLKPDQIVKQASISLALREFDKNNSKVFQGNTKAARLKSTAGAVRQSFFGGQMVKTFKLTLAGAVCTILIIGVVIPLYKIYEAPLDLQYVGTDTSTFHTRDRFLTKYDHEQKNISLDNSISSQNSDESLYQQHDNFKETQSNFTKQAKVDPVSTFSIDVDTASYSYIRNILNQNVLPQKDAVRVEELINYFPYSYPVPTDKSKPFKIQVVVFPTPWNKETKLLQIGIKGYQLNIKTRPPANLIFLIDTSGSMVEPNKLPLVQSALKLLVDTLTSEDSVGIVTYAGNAGIALPPTKINDKNKIKSIIDDLGGSGSTDGAEGIRQAYQLAKQHFNEKGINRVILATDGDFNVGMTDTDQLKSFIESERVTGVSLSVLGFGAGNYQDELMQTLAQNGNGNAAYIDNLNEAKKVLVEESSSTLFAIAKDVKIQVEFNPDTIAEYRLIGYETRALNTEDFNNDKIDAGDIGAGHSVTALYEITPLSSKGKLIDKLRYNKKISESVKTKNNEYAFVKVRYKLPDSGTSQLITTSVNADTEFKSIDSVPEDSRFATAVAAFGQLLRGDNYLKKFTYDDIVLLAESGKGDDPFGYRGEFINLVRNAKNVSTSLPVK